MFEKMHHFRVKAIPGIKFSEKQIIFRQEWASISQIIIFEKLKNLQLIFKDPTFGCWGLAKN